MVCGGSFPSAFSCATAVLPPSPLPFVVSSFVNFFLFFFFSYFGSGEVGGVRGIVYTTSGIPKYQVDGNWSEFGMNL